MNYVAFRIDASSIRGRKVIFGFFVRGQRDTDYNWSVLHEAKDMEEAKAYIKSIRTDPDRQPVYGPDGYGIKI